VSEVVVALISVGVALGLLQLAIGGFMLAVWRETRADMREFERAMRAIGYDVAELKADRARSGHPPSV